MKLLNKLKSIVEYSYLMGIDWFLFRIKYELQKRFNYFDKVNKEILNKLKNLNEKSLFYKRINLINKEYLGKKSAIEKADNALKGRIYAFSHEYFDYNDKNCINWQLNPVAKKSADVTYVWNKLRDFGEYGDIKLIWEASRFAQVYYYINAYSITKDEKYAKRCIYEIKDWIKKNPYPFGANYKCGQEITFKLFSWLIALEYFNDFVSKDDEKLIVKNIYVSLLRIEANIDYAARSVKNNHSISEAAGLFIGGLLFPQFNESGRFLDKGLKYLLQETAYQVYGDGSYIQHSFIYQRLALDVLSFVQMITYKKKYKLPQEIKERHKKMIEFLYSFVQCNGWLPNYGSNDGANLFTITEDDYRDFRSHLNFASALNGGKVLYDDHLKLIELFSIDYMGKKKINKTTRFDYGGYYILKNSDTFAFIRSHSYKDRPASNDMLHLDIWHKGKNIFCDTGSYSYNTDKKFKNNFIGAIGHNTIMVNNSNHMKQVLNFGFSNWTRSECKNYRSNYFEGENYAYEKEYGIVLNRSVELYDDKIVTIDKIKNISNDTNIKQIWNTKDNVIKLDKNRLKVDGVTIESNIDYSVEDSYISDYYNSYFIGKKIVYEVYTKEDFEIETTIRFKE